MTYHKVLAGLIVVLVLCLALVACGSEPAPEAASEAVDEPVEEAPAAEAEVPTATPEPTPEPTEEMPIPAGASNADWEPVEGELNGLPMVYVPAGCFMMGSTEEQIAAAIEAHIKSREGAPFPCESEVLEAEGPQNEVCLEAFWIGQTEVTNSQYAACVEAGACAPPADRTYFDNPDYADHPVIQVSWQEAVNYAEWLGAMLPTEAQWEYAARGPEAWVYPWGDEFERERLNYCDVNCDIYWWADPDYDDGYALTAPVGTYPGGASWVGAVDMAGNVWEWTASLYRDYPYDAGDGREDPEAAGVRVLRGGAFDVSAVDMRTALRFGLETDDVCRGYGFRVAALLSAIELP